MLFQRLVVTRQCKRYCSSYRCRDDFCHGFLAVWTEAPTSEGTLLYTLDLRSDSTQALNFHGPSPYKIRRSHALKLAATCHHSCESIPQHPVIVGSVPVFMPPGPGACYDIPQITSSCPRKGSVNLGCRVVDLFEWICLSRRWPVQSGESIKSFLLTNPNPNPHINP